MSDDEYNGATDNSPPPPGPPPPQLPPDTGVGVIPGFSKKTAPWNAPGPPAGAHATPGEDPIGAALTEVTDSEIDRNPAVEAAPFPLHVLPVALADYVRAASASTGCEPQMIAVPMLAGFSGVIGNTCHVQVKSDWISPCSLWTMVVASSGAGKSPAFKAALHPIDDLAATFHAEYQENRARYNAELKAYKAQVTRAKKLAAQHIPGQSTAVPFVAPPPPVEPVERRLDFADVTVEALAPLLQKNPRGGILKCDELAVWINGFNQYKPRGKGTDSAKWNLIWDGQPLRIDRKTGDQPEIYVPRPFLSVAGGIQTSILAKSVGPEQLDSGLLARILVTTTVNHQEDCDWSEIDPELVEALTRTYTALSSLDFSHDAKRSPNIIPIDGPARLVFEQWSNMWRARTRPILNEGIVAAMTKLAGYVPRLALVLHLVDAAQPRTDGPRFGIGRDGIDLGAIYGSINENTVNRAISLAEWFAVEAHRLYSHLATDSGDTEARAKILNILEAERDFPTGSGDDAGWLSSRDLQRQHCGKNATHLAELLEWLANRGFIEKRIPVKSKPGRPPSPRWRYVGQDGGQQG